MTPTNNELIAILMVKKMLTTGSPNMSEFLEWIAERLVNIHNENENLDFVHSLKKYAKAIKEVEVLLSIGKN